MVEPVTVIINNCNLVTWPRAMVAAIEKFEHLAEILIIDNGSTYPPLLEWYEELPHRVLRLGNVGHTAPWTPEVKQLRQLKTGFYVVTDPDLDLSATPTDCLAHLQELLVALPHVGKIGLGLTIDDVPPESPCWPFVDTLERGYWAKPVHSGGVRDAPVDTTFAMYNVAIWDQYGVGGCRTDHPYTARHIPWSIIEPNEEYRYYLAHAASTSSCYKKYIRPSG